MLGLPFASARDEGAVAPVVVRSVEISAPVTPFLFEGDLRDLPAPPEWKPGDPVKEIPRRYYPKPGAALRPVYEPGPDPLVQSQLDFVTKAISEFTTPTRNRTGQIYTGVNPPDTVGDVGPNYYIQMINSSAGGKVAIYDKALDRPNFITTFTLDNLGSGACSSGLGDPDVLYDRSAQRWLLSEFSSSGNNLCVYISQTDDPVSGGWYAYGFATPTFPDYPKYGVWATDANGGAGSYIVTANDGGPGIYALDRGAMLSGAPATYQRFSIPGLPGFGFESPTPADVDGPNPPPTGAPAIIMRHRDTEAHGPTAPGDLLEMWSFRVDWQQPLNSVLTFEPRIDVSEFDSHVCGYTGSGCFEQPGTGVTLDPLREVIMNRLQYIHHADRQTLVGNFVVDADGADRGGLRWFELQGGHGAWTLVQEGTYSIDSDNRWMAASAMDQSGNIAIGYNVSSSATFPSLRYTGRLVDDPPGVMTQPESVVHDGTASNSSFRYGDYASMNLDPSDDCTFWFTGMDNTSSTWRTQIASFRFDACGCELVPEPPLVDAVDNGDNRIDVSWDDSDVETVTEYLVRRSRSAGGPYETIAAVPDSSPGVGQGPGYVFEDNDVSGSITYYYVVVASDGLICKSDPLNEVAATGSGPCTLAPVFDGVQTVATPFDGTCTLELSWDDATPECGGPLLYNVYRSEMQAFDPGPDTLLAANYPGTTLVDVKALLDGATYAYIVRAVDQANGLEESNTKVLAGTPRGVLATGTWFDDAGDSGPAKMIATSPWQIDPAEGFTGPNAYKTGDYGNFTCAGLATPRLHLVAGSMLTFYSGYDIESSWDKGEVQISTDGGSSWERVPMSYPGDSTHTSDACLLPTGTYFTGTQEKWEFHSADLSAWQDQDVQLRFLISSDSGVTGTGWWIDDITITPVGLPGTCTPASTCAENPFVSVEPLGPITACVGGTVLSAELTGGSGPFAYQWLRDGVEITGAIGATYDPPDPDTHSYTCKVRSASCADETFGGLVTEITAVSAPFFDGVQSVGDAQAADCSVLVAWDPATSLCAGPIHYYVYRDTAPGVSPTPENIVASGLTSTALLDTGGLSEGSVYYYLVRSLDRSTRQFDANTVELSAAPTGPGAGSCTPSIGPVPVSDGRDGAVPLRGDRGSVAGDVIELSWDTSTCAAADYNLLFGDLSGVTDYTLTGSECALGTTGSYSWTTVPSGDLFFLIVGTDGAGTESSWGTDNLFGERNGPDPSGQCAATAKDTSGACQ